MQVKVYEARDMRSALEKVKNELGPEALILSSRNIYKDKLGVLGKPWIEVVAAVDRGSPETKNNDSPPKNGTYNHRTMGEKPGEEKEISETYNKEGRFKYLLEEKSQAPSIAVESEKSRDEESFINELRQMRQCFQGLSQEISEIKSQRAKQMDPPYPDYNSRNFDLEKSATRVLPDLDGLGLGKEALELLSHMIEKKIGSSNNFGMESMDNFLEQAIAEIVRVINPLSGSWARQKRISFIGPTGVGKTTTIAKVAANYLLNCGKKVVLATIDNYRIAAVEQLKIYGKIMNIPVETAKTPRELKAIFDQHQDKDLILLDTAGRSPRDELSLQELSSFLNPSLQIENHLVLSVTTRESDLLKVVQRFQHIELHGLVFTKLDESDLLGSILNVQLQAGYPVTFLTNGQKVPEDLLPHEPRHLARMIIQRNEVGEKWNFK